MPYSSRKSQWCGFRWRRQFDTHSRPAYEAKLGVISPTSLCHTFDARADGYGRTEGAGALYLKRLSNAVRDGDVIRAAIRSSAVNTNGKVPG